MINFKALTIITLLFCIGVFMLTILDFAALNDIKQDYVSQNILNALNIKLSEELPQWTTTTGEWQVVTISFYLRLVFFIVNLAVLVHFIRKGGITYYGTEQKRQ
jgi:hypothetical protein